MNSSLLSVKTLTFLVTFNRFIDLIPVFPRDGQRMVFISCNLLYIYCKLMVISYNLSILWTDKECRNQSFKPIRIFTF